MMNFLSIILIPVFVFWLVGDKLRDESQVHLIVHPLEEVLLRRLGDQPEHVAKRVFLVSEPIVGRYF